MATPTETREEEEEEKQKQNWMDNNQKNPARTHTRTHKIRKISIVIHVICSPYDNKRKINKNRKKILNWFC